MSLVSELTTIKEDISDGVVANKVSRFAYKQQAYDDNDADGTDNYDVNQDNNIPLGTPTVMKVNQTIVDLGWRARASSITRMLMNHFLGRVSYNLNKANDMINSILSNFISYMGQADGIATLDNNGKVPDTQLKVAVANGIATLDTNAKVNVSQLPKSDVAENTNTKMFTTKGAFDYFMRSPSGGSWLGKVFGNMFWQNYRLLSFLGSSSIGATIRYGNGIWVAGGSANGLWWSEDGQSWAQGTGGHSTYKFNSVRYANGIWVACSDDHGLWWSEDGKAWTQVTGTTASYIFSCVDYGNNLWVACSDYHGLWWSEDGKSWTQVVLGSTSTFRSILYANNLWVAGCGDLSATVTGTIWSTDGKTWSQESSSTGFTSMSIHYANGLWVIAVRGSEGAKWSTNGKTWTDGTGVGGTVNFGMRVHYGNGVWVLATYSGGLYKSTDGKAWSVSSVSSGRFWQLYYANGIWLAGSATTNGLYKSTDGTTWTQIINSIDVGVCYYSQGHWFAGVSTGFLYSGLDILESRGYFVD